MSRTLDDSPIAAAAAPPGRWSTLAVLLGGMTMITFVGTTANVATASLTASLGASAAAVSWAVSGYQVAYGLGLVPAGRIGDRYGHKWVFVAGVAGYVVMATIASFSTTELMLVTTRLLQGVMGGFVVAPIFAMIQLQFAGSARVRAFGVLSAVIGGAALVAPIIGGAIIDSIGLADGWRWAFALAVPIGLVTLIAAIPVLTPTKAQALSRFDVVGMLLLFGVIVAFLVPLVQIVDANIPAWSWISFALSVALAFAFAWWERRIERAGGIPLVPVSYFRQVNFSAGLLVSLLTFAAFTSSIYITLSVLWQSGREESAAAAGLLTLPLSLGSVIGGLAAERMTALLGRWTVPVSLVTLAGGYFATYALLASDPQASMLAVMIPLMIAGLGSGVFVAPNVSSILAKVDARDAGSAGGLNVTAQRIGAALGSAIIFIVISRPGAGGPTDFGPTAMFDNGLFGVLVCAILSTVALALSFVVAFSTGSAKKSPSSSPAAAHIEEVAGS